MTGIVTGRLIAGAAGTVVVLFIAGWSLVHVGTRNPTPRSDFELWDEELDGPRPYRTGGFISADEATTIGEDDRP